MTYRYPAVTVDIVIFGLDPQGLKVLLIRRGGEPFAGRWAVPGGFVREGESLDEAARRELREETGVRDVFLEQLYTFGDVDRDPRGRVYSVAYYALTQLSEHALKADTDAADAAWFDVHDLPPLAFDHDRIAGMALGRLRGKVRYEPIGFGLLPEMFTLGQLQWVYETILQRAIDKRNFRKKVMAMEFLVDTGQVQQDVAHRAARLYRFDEGRYQKLKKRGFGFEL